MEKSNKELYIGIGSIALWAIAAFLLLAWGYADYMHKVEELSLFVGTSTYLHQCMALPGGLLTWCSTALTCLLINQYVGAAVMVGVLLLLQIVAIKAFKLPRRWWAASALLPMTVLLAFLRLGYDIFVIKPLGFAFALPLGLLFCLLAYWGCRKINDWRIITPVIAVIVVIGYPYFGFYALLAALMCGCCGLLDSLKARRWSGIVPMLVALALAIVIPQLYFRYSATDVMPSLVYLCPLPRFFASETAQWLVYASTFALMIAGALFAGKWRQLPVVASIGVWALALAALFTLRCSDKNLMHTLAMDRALNAQDWQRAAQMASDIDFEPTRLNTVLGYVAHLRNGSLGNQLFTTKYGWAPYSSARQGDPMHDAGGAIISYHLGLINYAYRWATEYMVEQGMGAERMKMMVKCALLNYETDLAKHYLDILYNVPNQREWARKYSKYATNPMEMGRDQELMAIKQLMCQPNMFINDGGSIEGYVWPLLASAQGGTPQFVELSIYAALINRDLDSAMANITAYVSAGGKPTAAMQQAALYWSKSNNVPCPIKIDSGVQNLYDGFVNAFRNTTSAGAEGQRDMLREPYGNTLWYYLIFTENQSLR